MLKVSTNAPIPGITYDLRSSNLADSESNHGGGQLSQSDNNQDLRAIELSNAWVLDDDNMSIMSTTTNATIPDRNAHQNFPDIMVLHIKTTPVPMPSDPEARVGWDLRNGERVSHCCQLVIGELKKAPPRGLRGLEYDEARSKLLSQAMADLTFYVSVAFARDPQMTSVIGMVGAGAWWKWAEIRREDATPYSTLEDAPKDSAVLVEARAKLVAAFSRATHRGPLVRLGTWVSDRQWTSLRGRAVDILNAHIHHQPPQPHFHAN